MMDIPSLKEVTKESAIKALPDAPFYHIPLKVKEGETPDIRVVAGDRVLQYQLLVKAGKAVRASVYSPVSGRVVKITGYSPGKGELPFTIYIENDFREDTAGPFSLLPPDADKEAIINRIEEAGILGHGGAEFPAALKYRTKGKKVKMLIVNGAECEPYLTADYAIMSQRTAEVWEGICRVAALLEVEEVVLGVEEQNKEVLQLFDKYPSAGDPFTFRTLAVPDEYPQGGELQLIYSATGIKLKNDTIPLDAHIVMNNVATLLAVREALVNHHPTIKRVLTVSGEASGSHGNYEVKLGTPVSHILSCTGVDAGRPFRILKGGPMMGKTVTNQAVSVSQGTNGILVLPELFIHRLPCIGCGYCVDVCPMSLVPFKYDHFYRRGDWKNMKQYNLEDCIDCASCEYICPCEVPLLRSITEGKKQLKKWEHENTKA